MSVANKALSGITVVDFTDAFWASMAGAMLGDFGADVVRVDVVGRPSSFKGGTIENDAEAERSLVELVQRNKRSIAVDLTKPEGVALLGKLVAKADVLLTDRGAKELATLGLDYETLSAAKPALIFAAGSALGPLGPDSDTPGIDELAAARVGMMPILPQPGMPPVFPAHGQMYTPVMLALGITAALWHRDKTGEGQRVDASLLGGNMYGASLDLQAFLAMGGERFLQPTSRLDAGNPMSGTVYPSGDGPWVTLTMPDTDRYWQAFSEELSIAVDDPRFDTHDKRCGDNRLELMQVLEAQFATKPAAHWRKVFTDRQMSADIIELYTYPEEDRDARANRYILDPGQEGGLEARSLGFPIHMSDTPAVFERRAPTPGQHSQEILASWLGLGDEEIAQLSSEGAVA
jgi:crotonobetainyl-CoA:carnitine CoA-transferase CaiB-like acyl-CoA transferase